MALDVLVMEHFIETVKRFPCLWKTTAIEYRDLELKEAAWNEVLKETHIGSVKEAKNKWKKLRDSYRDALKRQSDLIAKDPTNATKKLYPWKYMGLMQFLQPHMSNRPKKQTYECHIYPPPAENGQQNGIEQHTSDESDSGSEYPKRKNSDQLTVIDKKLDYLCKSQNKKVFTESHYEQMKRQQFPLLPDPLDIFFNSMCQATKRLPFQTQIKIKKVLFNAVIGAEEEITAEQQNYAMWANDAASSSTSNQEDDDMESKDVKQEQD